MDSTADQDRIAAAGADEGVDHGKRRAGRGFEVGAGVEAEPADPQHRGADHGQRHGMRRHVVLAVADALADQDAADQAGDAGIDVDDRAAGEVDRAEVEDVASAVPDHVGDREVDEGDPEDGEQDHGRELDAFGEGADDQRRRDGGEGHLEDDEQVFRNDDAVGEGGRRGRPW